MSRPLFKLGIALVMISSAALLAGCESAYPQPSEDAVYYFVANSYFRGKMRVCWPAGQEYAVGITKAYATYRNELEQIRTLLSYESLWMPDDPRWQDTEAVEDHLAELVKLDDEGAQKRRDAFEAIGEAIEKVPADLSFADDEARDAFKLRLVEALRLDVEDIAYYEAVLEARLNLFAKVRDCAESLDKNTGGLSFTDPACQDDVNGLYGESAAYAVESREGFLEHAEQRLPEIEAAVAEIDKQKQREDYNLLDSERSAIRRSLEAMPRSLRDLIKSEQDKLEDCKKADKPKQEWVVFHKRHIERLEAELERVDKRVQPILNHDKKAE